MYHRWIRNIYFGWFGEPSDRQIRYLWTGVAILTAAFIVFATVLHFLEP